MEINENILCKKGKNDGSWTCKNCRFMALIWYISRWNSVVNFGDMDRFNWTINVVFVVLRYFVFYFLIVLVLSLHIVSFLFCGLLAECCRARKVCPFFEVLPRVANRFKNVSFLSCSATFQRNFWFLFPTNNLTWWLLALWFGSWKRFSE